MRLIAIAETFEVIDVTNALVAAGIALAIGVGIFLNRHIRQK